MGKGGRLGETFGEFVTPPLMLIKIVISKALRVELRLIIKLILNLYSQQKNQKILFTFSFKILRPSVVLRGKVRKILKLSFGYSIVLFNLQSLKL